MIDVANFTLRGPLVITPKRFADSRGFFSETYNARALSAAGIAANFVQDNHSLSIDAFTVRGLHFQSAPFAQAKLIRVARGRALDVAVDIRKGSPTYGGHIAIELSAENWRQFFIPAGFAHGFCTLEPDTEILYKVSAYYSAESEKGIRWNDPALNIPWPELAGAQISAKDRALPNLSDIDSPFSFEPDRA